MDTLQDYFPPHAENTKIPNRILVVTNGAPGDLFLLQKLRDLKRYRLKVVQVTKRPYTEYSPFWRNALQHQLKALDLPVQQVNASVEHVVDTSFLTNDLVPGQVNRILWLMPCASPSMETWSKHFFVKLSQCGYASTICALTDAQSAVNLSNLTVKFDTIVLVIATRLPSERHGTAMTPYIKPPPDLERYTIMANAHDTSIYTGAHPKHTHVQRRHDRDELCRSVHEATDAALEKRLVNGHFSRDIGGRVMRCRGLALLATLKGLENTSTIYVNPRTFAFQICYRMELDHRDKGTTFLWSPEQVHML